MTSYSKLHETTYEKLREEIRTHARIVIFRHIKPDFDALGTQMGLYTFLKDNFPEKDVHFVGDGHPTFIPRLFPEPEKLEEDYFKQKFLAIVVDVGDRKRIADPRFEMADAIIKFDHHPANEEIAKVAMLDEESGAASEIVSDFCLSFPGTHLSSEAAKYFYIGLVGDTGRFMYSSTSTHTFEIAEALLKTGFNLSSLYQKMYEKKLDDLKVTAYVLNHFSVSPHGVAYYLLSDQVQKELAITSERGKENVNLFANIEGINAWCSLSEDLSPNDPCWRISIRSKEKDIAPIANKWGGGGHPQASGARLDDISDLDKFIGDLDALFIEE